MLKLFASKVHLNIPRNVFLFFAIVGAGHSQVLQLGAVVPQLRGETLEGKPLILPDSARGKIALLTVSFSKAAGERAGAWGARFSKDHAGERGVTNYSIAMLEGAPRLLRGMIKSGMKRGVPEAMRSRFLVVTSDEVAWKQYLDVRQDDVPYLLLIDGRGRVLWKEQGLFDERKYESLNACVADLLKSRSQVNSP